MILLMLRLDILKSVVMLVGLFSYSRLFKQYLMIYGNLFLISYLPFFVFELQIFRFNEDCYFSKRQDIASFFLTEGEAIR